MIYKCTECGSKWQTWQQAKGCHWAITEVIDDTPNREAPTKEENNTSIDSVAKEREEIWF